MNLLFAPHHGLQGPCDGLGLRPGPQRLARSIEQLLIEEQGLLVATGAAPRGHRAPPGSCMSGIKYTYYTRDATIRVAEPTSPSPLSRSIATKLRTLPARNARPASASSRRPTPATARPATIGGRGPRRAVIRPETTFITLTAAVCGNSARPAWSGERCCTCWRKRLMRNSSP